MGRTIVGGFVATVLFTLFLYYVAPFMLGGPINIAAMLAGLFRTTVAVGLFLHFILGTIIFPMIYAYVVFRIVSGSAWTRGLVFGLLLWLLAETIFVPLVGGGVFHTAQGGIAAVIAVLIGHVIYGIVLGVIAGGPRRPIATAG
jgi:uncharacterized membrane protein YagU involved in acid resistance